MAQAAVRGHLRHGDSVPGESIPGEDGYLLDEACLPEATEDVDDPEVTEETSDTFAIAYTDTAPDDGGYDPDVDVLIATFVDGNDNGVPDGGDKVITNAHPTTLEPTFTFEPFTVTEHTVLDAAYDAATGQWKLSMDAASTDFFVFQHGEGKEIYQERTSASANTWTTLRDSGLIDQIATSSDSRSQPGDLSVFDNLDGDLQFLDVEILVGP